MVLASRNFDCDMAQVTKRRQAFAVNGDRLRPVGDNRDDDSPMAGADLPEMEIGDSVSVNFHELANLALRTVIRNDVYQHGACVADEAVSPACDHAGSNETDDRIDPYPIEGAGGKEAPDGEHRCRGIGKHMHIGGSKIVVAVVPVMFVAMMVMS